MGHLCGRCIRDKCPPVHERIPILSEEAGEILLSVLLCLMREAELVCSEREHMDPPWLCRSHRMQCPQVIEYAKDESIALKKTGDSWKSNKRLKAEQKQAAAKQARTELPEQQQGTAPVAAATTTPARAQVRCSRTCFCFLSLQLPS
jgi:hypothetical protein